MVFTSFFSPCSRPSSFCRKSGHSSRRWVGISSTSLLLWIILTSLYFLSVFCRQLSVKPEALGHFYLMTDVQVLNVNFSAFCMFSLSQLLLSIFPFLSDLFSLHYRLTFSFFRILLSVTVIPIWVIPAPWCVFLHPATGKNLMLYFPPLCMSLYT